MIELAIVAVLCGASFVGGILVGRRHPAVANTVATVANTVKADARAVADDVQKKA